MTSIELKHKNEFREMLHRLHNEEFESSTCCTAQFAKFAAVFRQCMSRFFKTELKANIVRFSRGHFEITGFMHRKSGWWYFNTGDLRSRFMHCDLLLRSAKHDKDYSGGHNQYVPTITAAEFKAKFKAIVVAEQ